MKNKFPLIASFFTFSLFFAQQAPSIQWSACLGGMNMEGASSNFNTSQSSYGLQVVQTPDGGYITVGNTSSNSGYVTGLHSSSPDMWIVKTDSSGNFQWQKTLGSTGVDSAASVALTSDGGYIVAGYSTLNNGDVPENLGSEDIWIVKLDISGTVQWTKNLGSTGSEKAFSVKQTSDGGYIVAGASSGNDIDVSGHHGGWSTYDMWVVKLNSSGIIQWQKSLGGYGNEVGYSVQQTTDGGYVVAGYSDSQNNGDVTGNHTYWSTGDGAYLPSKDFWIVKLNAAGLLQWQKSLGGTGTDIAYSVQQTTDGGYIIGGSSNSGNGDVSGNHGNYDFWITKIDSNGTLQWQKSLGGTYADWAHFIRQAPDGGYVAAGVSFSNDGDVNGDHHGSTSSNDYWVVKITSSGLLSWAKSLGGNFGDTAFSLDTTQDGGYIIAGSSNSRDGDVTGMHINSDATDFWLVKLGTGTLSTGETPDSSTFSLYPNPVKNDLFFSEELADPIVYTADGKTVYKASHARQIDFSVFPQNIYFIQGKDKSGNQIVRKIIKK